MSRPALLALAVLAASAIATSSAGAAAPATVSGTVWLDADADGVRDSGERGVGSVRAELQSRAGKRFVRVAATKTGPSGRYRLKLPRRGALRLRIVRPAGAGAFTPRDRGRSDRVDSDVAATGTAAVRAGRSARIDAGILPAGTTGSATPAAPTSPPPPGTATGTVWRDVDGDGTREVGEPVAPTTVVQLWNADRTTQLAATTTGADGRWTLALPAAGSGYRLRVTLPPGARAYTPADSAVSDAVDSDVIDAGADAGYTPSRTSDGTGVVVDAGLLFHPPVTIRGQFWWDRDNDGVRGPTESKLLGSIELWDAERTARLATATTAPSDGRYEIVAPYGGLPVRLKLTTTYYPTGKQDQGADDTLDSDLIQYGPDEGWTLPLPLGTAGAAVANVDGGFAQPVNIGNRVWSDADGDGIQDAGELGRSDIRVEIWDAGRTRLLDAATTNASGNYYVVVRGGGTYRMRFFAPFNRVFSPKDASGDDGTDSDVLTSGTDAGWTDDVVIANDLISTSIWDAGLRPVPPIVALP